MRTAGVCEKQVRERLAVFGIHHRVRLGPDDLRAVGRWHHARNGLELHREFRSPRGGDLGGRDSECGQRKEECSFHLGNHYTPEAGDPCHAPYCCMAAIFWTV